MKRKEFIRQASIAVSGITLFNGSCKFG